MLNKGYVFIAVSFAFFVFSIGYISYISLGWNEPIDESESSVQINLPVIDWDRYLNLSKRLE